MRFEWDPSKAQINRRKHEVSFEEAAECFADSLGMILTDHVHADRLILIGQSQSRRLIFTVYAERDADVIRIISARKATRAERRTYEEGEF
ncbi:MAG: BrnT family toxin [Deltaproteobacteria bacterium]|nr:MAG: BrnT family toxin [Deltaproteobacteria bacterium]TMQ16971.1 MAG: BrnT family toxin [Deltaproteobacteria bacterium]